MSQPGRHPIIPVMPDPGSEVASVPDLDSQIDSLLRDMTETADAVGRELLGDSKAGLEPEAPKAGVPVSDAGEVATQEIAADLDALLSETQEELASQVEAAAAEVVEALPGDTDAPADQSGATLEMPAPAEAPSDVPAAVDSAPDGEDQAPSDEPSLAQAEPVAVATPEQAAGEPTLTLAPPGADASEPRASADAPGDAQPAAVATPPDPAPEGDTQTGAAEAKSDIQALDAEIASTSLDLDGDFASDEAVLTEPAPAAPAPTAAAEEVERLAETDTTANAAGRLAQVAAPVAALSEAGAVSDSAAKVKAAALLTVGAGLWSKLATGAKAAAGSSVVAKACATISKPLADKPPLVKQMVGYLALLQVFLAACVWLYTLVLRTPKVPEPTGPEVALYDPSKPVHEQASHAKPASKDDHGAAKDSHGKPAAKDDHGAAKDSHGKPAAKDSHGASSKAKPAAKDSHGASSKSKSSSKDSHGKPAEKAKGGGGH